MSKKYLSFKFSNPLTKEELEKAYSEGMIKKEDLISGAYYIGTCRNSYVAQWNKKDNCFYYIRNKFGDSFLEAINHPSDDDNHDLFIPMQKVEDIYE